MKSRLPRLRARPALTWLVMVLASSVAACDDMARAPVYTPTTVGVVRSRDLIGQDLRSPRR